MHAVIEKLLRRLAHADGAHRDATPARRGALVALLERVRSLPSVAGRRCTMPPTGTPSASVRSRPGMLKMRSTRSVGQPSNIARVVSIGLGSQARSPAPGRAPALSASCSRSARSRLKIPRSISSSRALLPRARRSRRLCAYYHNAVYGLWRSDSDGPERARLELIEFLPQRDERRLALAELLVATTDPVVDHSRTRGSVSCSSEQKRTRV